MAVPEVDFLTQIDLNLIQRKQIAPVPAYSVDMNGTATSPAAKGLIAGAREQSCWHSTQESANIMNIQARDSLNRFRAVGNQHIFEH